MFYYTKLIVTERKKGFVALNVYFEKNSIKECNIFSLC